MLFATAIFAQLPAWMTIGNAANPGDIVGTTNNVSLLSKSNNTLGIEIKSNGLLNFKSLDVNAAGQNG
jgi:hypothetical protein